MLTSVCICGVASLVPWATAYWASSISRSCKAFTLSTVSLLVTTLSTADTKFISVSLYHLCIMSFASFVNNSKSYCVIAAKGLWQSLFRSNRILSISSPMVMACGPGSFPHPLVGLSVASRIHPFRKILYDKLVSKSSEVRLRPGLKRQCWIWVFSWPSHFTAWRVTLRSSIVFFCRIRLKRNVRPISRIICTAFANLSREAKSGSLTARYTFLNQLRKCWL